MKSVLIFLLILSVAAAAIIHTKHEDNDLKKDCHHFPRAQKVGPSSRAIAAKGECALYILI